MSPARRSTWRGLVAASSVPATVTAAGIREIAARGAITMNAAAKVLGKDHQDHDKEPGAERPGIGTDDVEQLAHARILAGRKRTDRKSVCLKEGISGLGQGSPTRPSILS